MKAANEIPSLARELYDEELTRLIKLTRRLKLKNDSYDAEGGPHVRKVRHGRIFTSYTSSIDDYANMYDGLYSRLLRYRSMKPKCLIKIRIYEGENANEANRSYAETDNVQGKWPLTDEGDYK